MGQTNKEASEVRTVEVDECIKVVNVVSLLHRTDCGVVRKTIQCQDTHG